MASKYKVWGEAVIRVNGIEIEQAGKVTLMPGGKERPGVEADNKAGFYTTKSVESSLEFDALVTASFSIVEAQDWDDVTVSIEFDTGQSFVINHARTVDNISANDGKAKVKMAGPAAEELTA